MPFVTLQGGYTTYHGLDISESKNARWKLIVCDTYDYEDYRVLVPEDDSLADVVKYYSKNMQRVHEVIDLRTGEKVNPWSTEIIQETKDL